MLQVTKIIKNEWIKGLEKNFDLSRIKNVKSIKGEVVEKPEYLL